MSRGRVRFSLGTAQFGLAYGRHLSSPVPEEEVARILSASFARSVDALDTAAAYGNAEEVIGRRMPVGARFAVTTKISRTQGNVIGQSEVDAVTESVSQSLRNLRVDVLDSVLFHHSDDLLKPGGGALFEALAALKSGGRIGRIGVSVYEPGELDRLLDRFPIEVVQLPFNILDQRFLRSGHLELLSRKGIEVQVRSVFLQGVLLSDIPDLPPRFAAARDLLQEIDAAASALGLSRQAFLLRCVTATPYVSSVVVGVDGLAHLNENLNAFEEAEASDDLPGLSRYAVDDSDLVDPRRWS